MKEVYLEIGREAVMQEVHKITAYEGSRIPPLVAKDGSKVDADRYKDVHTVKANEELLDKYWEAACGLAGTLTLIVPYARVQHTEGQLMMSLTLPHNWEEGLLESVKSACKQGMEQKIVGEWLSVVGMADKAASYLASSKESIDKSASLLQQRKRPPRRHCRHE